MQVHKAVADTLHVYRKHCAAQANPGQLILPEALKLLPLYALALTKLPAFRCTVKFSSIPLAFVPEDARAVHTRLLLHACRSCGVYLVCST